MSLIVYIPRKDEPGKRIQKLIGDLVWKDTIEIFYNFKRLSSRLGHPVGNEDIALLLASSPVDLGGFIASKHLLSNLRLILILPDDLKDTVARGHLLRPRFISYRHSDFSDVALVLQNMGKAAYSKSSFNPKWSPCSG